MKAVERDEPTPGCHEGPYLPRSPDSSFRREPDRTRRAAAIQRVVRSRQRRAAANLAYQGGAGCIRERPQLLDSAAITTAEMAASKASSQPPAGQGRAHRPTIDTTAAAPAAATRPKPSGPDAAVTRSAPAAFRWAQPIRAPRDAAAGIAVRPAGLSRAMTLEPRPSALYSTRNPPRSVPAGQTRCSGPGWT